MSEKLFAASWDRRLIASTIVLVAICLGAAALVLLVPLSQQNTGEWYRWLALIIGTGIIAIVAAAGLAAPRRFVVTDQAVVIQRWLGAVTIPFPEIVDVDALNANQMRDSFKTVGTSGMFGSYGRFWNNGLGEFQMYATHRNGYVLIRTKERLYVITPDNTTGFIDTARASMSR